MAIKKNELTVENDRFSCLAESFRFFLSKDKKLQEEKKSGSIPITIRRIIVDCKRSGRQYKFSAMNRGGNTTFGDPRATDLLVKPRYRPQEMVKELVPMIGEFDARRLVDTATMI